MRRFKVYHHEIHGNIWGVLDPDGLVLYEANYDSGFVLEDAWAVVGFLNDLKDPNKIPDWEMTEMLMTAAGHRFSPPPRKPE